MFLASKKHSPLNSLLVAARLFAKIFNRTLGNHRNPFKTTGNPEESPLGRGNKQTEKKHKHQHPWGKKHENNTRTKNLIQKKIKETSETGRALLSPGGGPSWLCLSSLPPPPGPSLPPSGPPLASSQSSRTWVPILRARLVEKAPGTGWGVSALAERGPVGFLLRNFLGDWFFLDVQREVVF